MPRQPKKKRAVKTAVKSNELGTRLDELVTEIDEYAAAAVDDSWKGGGDPTEIEPIELRLSYSRARVISTIEKIRREFEGY